MSFTDNLKKSLGFDENDGSNFNLRNSLSLNENQGSNFNLRNTLGLNENQGSNFNLRNTLGLEESRKENYNEYYDSSYDEYNYGLDISSEFDDEYLDDFTISPEQPFYEIVLIKPKSMDEMDYIFDQIVEEGNPVILDLIFLQKKGSDEYKQAASRLKILRDQYSAHAILLSKTSDKNLILISPSRVKVSNKD